MLSNRQITTRKRAAHGISMPASSIEAQREMLGEPPLQGKLNMQTEKQGPQLAENHELRFLEGMVEERGTHDSGNGNDTKEERKASNFLPQPQVGAKLPVTTHPQNLLNRCPLRDLQAGCPINTVEPRSSLNFHHVPFIYV